jgi:peptidoglycan endopeptidase LytE
MKAIQDANPGVDSTKLQIGQKLVIPAPTARAETPTGQPLAESASGEAVYVVKSGDTLTKIAGEHRTTVKALRAENDLKTDKIKVGQKLKIPAKASAPAPAVPAEPVPMLPVPIPVPATPPGR